MGGCRQFVEDRSRDIYSFVYSDGFVHFLPQTQNDRLGKMAFALSRFNSLTSFILFSLILSFLGLPENIPDEVAIEGDLGFQGLQNEFINVHLPHKKPRGQELTEAQKEENREFSSQRVICEHAHAGIKRCRSVADIYRNRVQDFDDRLMLNATGLWNFYLEVA